MRIVFAIALGLVFTLVVGGAYFVYYHLAGPILYSQCSFPLTVEIASEKGGIAQVCCEAYVNSAMAEERLIVMTKLFVTEPLSDDHGVLERKFVGKPLIVGLSFDRTVYPLGKERGHYCQRKLVVVAQYKDNRRIGMIVDIPPHDPDLETRTVTVNLP